MFNSDLNIIRPRKNSVWIEDQNNKNKMDDNATYYIYTNQGYYPVNFKTGFATVSKNKAPNQGLNYDENETKIHISTDNLRKYATDYCVGSTLHGLRYVGIGGVSLFERLFWVLSFIIAIGFSTYFISNIYAKWDYTPVIVGINPKFKTISSIPFPAITICNMNQAKKSVALDIIKSDDDLENQLLEDFCNLNYAINNFSNLTDEKSSKWDTVKNFMIKVSQPCNQMFQYCQWNGDVYSCNDLINSALTDEGVCCTFNRVASGYMYNHPRLLGDFNISFPANNIDWTPEVGYPENAPFNTWPFRPLGAGAHLGLTIVADINVDDYFCSSTNSLGLKVRLHSPVESPMIADFGFFLHPMKEIRVAISPTVDEASPTIYNIPIEKRQCLFSYERELHFFRTYTKNNCEMECISNYTLDECACVPYYLPKSTTTKICGKKKEPCYKKAKADMETSLNPEIFCKCLPACYEISYTQDVSIADISNPNLRKAYANQTEMSDILVVHFYFSNTQFRSYQKSELFGFTEFLANSGGLLGLFLGFSFLSAVEIFYHLTLKLWCAYYKRHRQTSVKVYPFVK